MSSTPRSGVLSCSTARLGAARSRSRRRHLARLVALEQRRESRQPSPSSERERLEVLRALGRAVGYPPDKPFEPRTALLPDAPLVSQAEQQLAGDLRCMSFSARSELGRSCEEQNLHYSIENHIEMALDSVRVSAFDKAIKRVACGRRVLDVGSGAFCILGRIALKAGAAIVQAVEQNEKAVQHMIELFKMEMADVVLTPLEYLRMTCAALCPDRMQLIMAEPQKPSGRAWEVHTETSGGVDCSGSSQASAGLRVVAHVESGLVSEETPGCCEEKSDLVDSEHSSQCCTVLLWPDESCATSADSPLPTSLEVHRGLSSDLPLEGPYDLVVHELLGHIASAEGVATTIADLLDRGLCSQDCIFVPAAAGTFFAPTAMLELSKLESTLHSLHNGGESKPRPQTKYNVLRFDPAVLIAAPKCFEWLEFGPGKLSNLRGCQRRSVEFITSRDAHFDGLHLHLHVQLDSDVSIDCLQSETSWSTTYIRLLDQAIWLPQGSRLSCECSVNLADDARSGYTVSVWLSGEDGTKGFVADFSWQGSS